MDKAECVTDVPFADKSNQHSNDELMIGFMTKQSLQKLKDEVKPREIRKFYISARELFVGAALYITQKFPWDDPVFKHVCFVYFEKRKVISFESVEYFVTISRALSNCRLCRWGKRWISWVPKSTGNPDILESARSGSLNEDEQHKIRADTLWHKLDKQRDCDGKKKFGLLAPAAKLVLTLPHSSADEEQIFSLVRKHKTIILFRPNLSVHTTLPNSLQCKVNGFSHMNCLEFEPTCDLLQRAMQTTWQYSKEHSAKPWHFAYDNLISIWKQFFLVLVNHPHGCSYRCG